MLTRRALKYMRSRATILQPMHSRQCMTMYSFRIHALSYFHHVFLNYHSKANPLDIQTKNELVKWLSSSQQKKKCWIGSITRTQRNTVVLFYISDLESVASVRTSGWGPAMPLGSRVFSRTLTPTQYAQTRTCTHTYAQTLALTLSPCPSFFYPLTFISSSLSSFSPFICI